MSDAPVKTCATCRHFGGPPQEYYTPHVIFNQPRGDQARCNNPNAATRDLIYGHCFCYTERNEQKGCGKQGKLWESQATEKSA
jgi:hypothetical protein